MLASAARHAAVGLWSTFMLWGLALRASQAAKAARDTRRKVAAYVQANGTEGHEGAVMELVEEAEVAIAAADTVKWDAVDSGVPDRAWTEPLAAPAAIPTTPQLSVMLHEMVGGSLACVWRVCGVCVACVGRVCGACGGCVAGVWRVCGEGRGG